MFKMSKSTIAERAPRVSLATLPLHVLVLVSALLLSGCDRGKVETLEAENTKLKSELEKVQELVKELATKQKGEAATEARRKQELAEQEEKVKREQEAKKAQVIDKCFDRIKLQMKALMDEPQDFALKRKAEREAIESRLKTLANSKQTDIGEIIIEVKGLEFPATSDLEFATRSYVRNYTSMIFNRRLSYDYIEMGSDKHKELSADALKSMSLAYDDMAKVSDIKRNVGMKKSGLKEKP